MAYLGSSNYDTYYKGSDKFYDSGDGVEYEIWICKKTSKKFVVPIEIKRYFEDAIEIENKDY